ncbi:MAG: succinate dehydrogenase cytochrome b subunit [Candidatus Binataceae bacterium]
MASSSVASESAAKTAPVTERPAVFGSNPLTLLWRTVIGKKIVMAVTGVIMVLFVIAHMLGNLKIFAGPHEINTYSRFLRTVGMPELGYGDALWIIRIVLLVSATLHIVAAIQLTRMNWQARPIGYRERKDRETSFAARSMRWGGLLLAIFIVFHIAHFTLGVVGFAPGEYRDLHVYQNVLIGFSVWPVSVFYIIAMLALFFHLDHGMWSMLQTLGWNTARNQATLRLASRLVAAIVFVGFVSVPVAVLAGWIH